MTIVEPETWDRQGVSLEEISSGQMAVIHVPEVHEKIVATLERIEHIASRRVEAAVYRMKFAEAPSKMTLSPDEWNQLKEKPLQLHGNILLRDGQRNHHSSGILRELLTDHDVSEGSFDPIMSVVRDGFSIDVTPQITVAGVLTTARISGGFSGEQKRVPMESDGENLAELSMQKRQYGESNDTRLIPFNGAACYHLGDDVLIIHVSVSE